jgi:hypothetical protein
MRAGPARRQFLTARLGAMERSVRLSLGTPVALSPGRRFAVPMSGRRHDRVSPNPDFAALAAGRMGNGRTVGIDGTLTR